MIYKLRKPGTSKVLITFELPEDLRNTQCSLIGDFNKWNSTVDIFLPEKHYRITKEFDYGTEHEFLYQTTSGTNHKDRSSDGVRDSKIGKTSLVIATVPYSAPFSAFGLNLGFKREQVLGLFILGCGFLSTLYIFAIYLSFHGVSFNQLLLLPLSNNSSVDAETIIKGAGNFNYVSFQEDKMTPTFFALFLEIYTWSALGVLANQVYKIYEDMIVPGPVIVLSHVASWLQAIIARPPVAAVIILLIQTLQITVANHSLTSLTGVIAVSFLAGFSSSFSDKLVLTFTEKIEKAVEKLRSSKNDDDNKKNHK